MNISYLPGSFGRNSRRKVTGRKLLCTQRRQQQLWPPRSTFLLFFSLLVFWNFSMPKSSLSPSKSKTKTGKPPDSPFVALPSTSNHNKTSSSSSSSPFAYAFLLGGFDPSNHVPFTGYLYNILVATQTLRSSGSRADIVVMIQPVKPKEQAKRATASDNYSNASSSLLLPKAWKLLLENSMGIRLVYLDVEEEGKTSFFSIQLQKFKILELYESYQRVLFLDADIVPFCNLDYLFEASMAGIIQPNFVLSGTDAPAAGNFFMLQPGPGEYETLYTQIIQPTVKTGHWSVKRGWGYEISDADPWQRLGYKGSKFFRNYLHLGEKGTTWSFKGAAADQGLLYHWVKYVKRNVTIAIGPVLETWQDDTRHNPNESKNRTKLVDTPILVDRSSYYHPLHDLSCRKQRKFRFHSKEGNTAPYSDYEHNKKIWERNVLPSDVDHKYDADSPAQFWFHTLRELDRQFGMNIDWAHWLEQIGNKARPFGKEPKIEDFEMAATSINI